MKTGLLTICLAILLPCLGKTQIDEGFLLTGTVLSSDTQEPVWNVNVVTSQLEGCTVDWNGGFSLRMKVIPEFVVIKASGYHSDTIRRLRKIWPENQRVFDYQATLRPIPMVGGPVPIVVEIEDYLPKMDRVRATAIRRGDNSSIEQALNLVPGLKFESRGPGGSRRLAIRGGFLRSPFGVRDVKAYLEGSPLTNPDGSTAMELIDPISVVDIEVFKGPWASRYGPVSSGVALFSLNQHPQIGDKGGSFSQTLGSYGYLRSALQIGFANKKDRRDGASLTLVRQTYAGYRAQEANGKVFAQLLGNAYHGRHLLKANATYYQGFWELPGSLDSAEAMENPRQALPVSESGDAHVSRRHLRLGLTHEVDLGGSNRIYSNAYYHWTDKENPYATSLFNKGYKLEEDNGLGGRAVFLHHKKNGQIWRFGAEYQVAFLDFLEFENEQGSTGALNVQSRSRSTQAHAFASLDQWFGEHMQLLADASLSKVAYLQSEAWSSVEAIPLGKTNLAPTPAGSISLKWRDFTYAQRKSFTLRLATGYSPPALWELSDSTGQFLRNLRPEYGLNGELAGKLRFLNRKLQTEFSLYHHTIWNTIVPQMLNSGRTVFENNGRTTQMGLEMYASLPKIKLSRKADSHLLVLTASGALQHYRFNDYQLDGVSLAGKSIPGVPLFTANLLADWQIHHHTEIRLTQQFVGKSWLDNANTVAQPSYMLLNFKASHIFWIQQYRSQQFGVAVTIAPFVGVNNLLNTRYTNFPNLNAINGRYWNPAPGINGFGGIDINF